MEKETVMLVFYRKIIARLFVEHIQNNTNMDAVGVYEFNKVKNMTLVHKPTLALVEIPERHGNPVQEALDVCGDITEACPGCKIMLMCPEQDKKSVNACEEAVKSGKIKDYVFYETSPEYLTSKLKTMCFI